MTRRSTRRVPALPRRRECVLHGNAPGNCPICDMPPAEEAAMLREIADRLGGELGARVRERAATIERALARRVE